MLPLNKLSKFQDFNNNYNADINDDISKDALGHIFSVLPTIQDLNACALTCKRWKSISGGDYVWAAIGHRIFGKPIIRDLTQKISIKQMVSEKIKEIATLYPEPIIKALGGLEVFCKFPILNLSEPKDLEYAGSIKLKDVSAPIMRGICVRKKDGRKIPFITICYKDLSQFPNGDVRFLDCLFRYDYEEDYDNKNLRNWIFSSSDGWQSHPIADNLSFRANYDLTIDYLTRLFKGLPCGSIEGDGISVKEELIHGQGVIQLVQKSSF